MKPSLSKLTAGEFLDKHWPEEWPEYAGEGVAFYESTLKEWELECEAAIQDRWIEFRDKITSHMKAEAPTKERVR